MRFQAIKPTDAVPVWLEESLDPKEDEPDGTVDVMVAGVCVAWFATDGTLNLVAIQDPDADRLFKLGVALDSAEVGGEKRCVLRVDGTV